ncbi:MAG TPA: LamG domain-containing protein [Candidatus Paceibacterota bacterium]|jgi:hypothetical protein|nr:LamG domain-containing protein [Candidatus Paceibacterota bacterium]
MKKIFFTLSLILILSAGGHYAYALEDITTGLVAHYTFDEGPVKNVTVIDSSGNGHDGTPVGNGSFKPQYSTDTPINTYSMSFNLDAQQGSAVNIGNFLDNDPTMSVCTWYKGHAMGQDEMILGKWGAGGQPSGSGWGMMQYITGENKIDGQVQDPGGSNWIEQNFGATQDNLWHHICMVLNGDLTTGLTDSSMRFYIDGVHYNSDPDVPGGLVQSSGTVHSFTNTSDIILGGSQGGQNTLEGMLADVRLYDRPLTDAQVLALYNKQGSTAPQYKTKITTLRRFAVKVGRYFHF